jgi:hypothetical protein
MGSWLLKEMKQQIAKTLSDSLLANSGSLVLSFLAHFPTKHLARDKKLSGSLRDIVDGDPFAGAFWPLTLELTTLGKGDPSWKTRSTLGVLRTLHDAKISIIDWEALPKVFLERLNREDDGNDDDGPDYALEDFGSDYGEDGENEDDEDSEEGEEGEEGEDQLSKRERISLAEVLRRSSFKES